MANIFKNVQGLHPKRNAFSSDTYRNDFTGQLGVNIPCYFQEVPPATLIKCNASALVRLQALIAPIMDNIDYYVHFWKIPYRVIEFDRFTAFISGEIPPEDYDSLFATPYEVAEEVRKVMQDTYLDGAGVDAWEVIFGNGGIFDFLGYDRKLFPDILWVVPDNVYTISGGNNKTILNWRGLIAYFLLHQNWYMNENVPYFSDFVEKVDSLVKEQSIEALAELLVNTVEIFGYQTGSSMMPHGWPKDYFTSALPNVQFGDPVTLPLASSAPVSIPAQTVIVNPIQTPTELDYIQVRSNDGNEMAGYNLAFDQIDGDNGKLIGGTNADVYIDQITGQIEGNSQDGSLTGTADLSEASVISINELRFANALQVFKERQLRFGRRRQEYYKGFFDVSPEDLRLQLPKYLGGGRIPINIADIEQTSATSGTSALGHLGGKATAVAGGFAGFKTFCSEESVIIGIAFAIPRVTYANSLSRFKMKTNDRYDYFNPSFEHLGEQSIKKIEIYSGATDPDGDFGYQPRFTEYRFHGNEMHGDFKGSLSFWTLGRIFNSQPALNARFIYMNPHNFDRIFAVSNQKPMLVSMLFHVKSIKPVSKYGTPMLLV